MRSLIPVVALGGCSIENTFLPQHKNDVFDQAAVPAVDILFVVDNSASMSEEQIALADGFQSFIDQIETAAIDFHIGIITTSQDTDDPNRGHLIGDRPLFLTRSDDYVNLFDQRVQIGTNGSDKEKGLDAAQNAISLNMLTKWNIGFVRPGANLLIIIVSDEDDCSDDGALDGQDAKACYQQRELLVPVQTEVDRIRSRKIQGELVQIAGILGPFDGSCQDSYPGRRYAQAVLQTGGLLGKICDADWSSTLGSLGLNALGILDQFKLSSAADPTSLVVSVDGTQVSEDDTDGWTYDSLHWLIIFHGTSVPPEGSEITVEYDTAPSSGNF